MIYDGFGDNFGDRDLSMADASPCFVKDVELMPGTADGKDLADFDLRATGDTKDNRIAVDECCVDIAFRARQFYCDHRDFCLKGHILASGPYYKILGTDTDREFAVH
jgi:hypothetical protein